MRVVNTKKLSVKSVFIQHHQTGAGFTLIELLVVISIIGILATLVAANLNSARSRARDAERKSDLKNISTALRLYYNDESRYPASFSFSGSFTDSSTTYMENVPDDPLTSQSYDYKMGTITDPLDTDHFRLSACLENSSDAQGKTSSGFTCPSGWMFQISQ